MTIHKICCDHCGKELDSVRDWVEDEIIIADVHIERDLCSDCVGDLIKIIEDFCAVTVSKEDA